MENSNKTKLACILKKAEKERIKLKHPYVGSEHLLLALLKDNSEFNNFLNGYELNYDSFKKELIEVVGSCKKENGVNLYTPLLRKIIKRYENKNQDVYESNIYEDLFISLLDEGEGIAIRIMIKMNIDLDDLYFNLKEKKKMFEMETSNKVGVLLNRIVDTNERVIGRENEINKLIVTLLRKKKCNPLLIGPAGVGKTAIVEELTRRIITGNVPEELNGYKVFLIEMGSLISGTKYRGEFEERLNKIIKEIINDKKTIIFIDEIHSMLGAGGAEGAINASDILKPYLARGEIKCIGATTTLEYNNTILKDKALSRRFDIINVNEPTNEEMEELLYKVKKEYELYHNIKVPKSLIKRIIELSNYYLRNVSNPDKSIDLLDSSCASAKINGNKTTLTEDDIIKTIYDKTNNCLINNKLFINGIKKDLKHILDGKNINRLCDSFKFESEKPISILLNNEKIEQIIKNNLKNINIVNIDLNKYIYHNVNSLSDNLLLTDSIFNSMIDKPYSLVIFENINCANKYLLDEISKININGYITFKFNEKLYFNNAVILAKYNNDISKQTGFSNSVLNGKLPKSFIDSFSCDLRNISKVEISSC